MKEIDILNGIANGEIKPGFKIKSKTGNIYEYIEGKGHFVNVKDEMYVWTLGDFTRLNDEIEIIEEDKEIEIIDKTEEQMKFYNCTYNKETKEYEFELKDIEIDYLFKNFEGNKGNISERLDKNFKEIEYYLKALANAVNELKKGK